MQRQVLPVGIAMAVGLIVVAASLLNVPELSSIANVIINWAALLGSLALLLGLWNVLTVHVQRLAHPDRHSIFSAVILLSAIVTLIVSMPEGTEGAGAQWIFNYVYRPLEASFLALIAFFIATAAFRSLRAHSIETTLMLITALIILIGQVPLGAFLAPVKEWVMNVPVVAGQRGILIGVTLGAIATSLRLLVGADRPYAE
jgi:uncharacterized membrane protein YhaH (DUF805 family)